MTNPRNITIIGGHGKVALLLAPLLSSDGHRVRSVIRNPEHAPDVSNTGATPVVADVEHTQVEGLKDLLAMQDVIVWTAGAGGGDPARTLAVDRDAAIRTIDAAALAGAARFVMVSFSGSSVEHLGPEGHPFNTYMQAKIEADEHLRASPLNWTIVAPGTLTNERSEGGVNPGASFGNGDETPRELVAQTIRAAIDSPQAERRTLIFGKGDLPLDEWLPSN
jgi:uncharacterized protein YbjT (DUF2867 family)